MLVRLVTLALQVQLDRLALLVRPAPRVMLVRLVILAPRVQLDRPALPGRRDRPVQLV